MTARVVVTAAVLGLTAAVCPLGAAYLLICAGRVDQRIRHYLEARSARRAPAV